MLIIQKNLCYKPLTVKTFDRHGYNLNYLNHLNKLINTQAAAAAKHCILFRKLNLIIYNITNIYLVELNYYCIHYVNKLTFDLFGYAISQSVSNQ